MNRFEWGLNITKVKDEMEGEWFQLQQIYTVLIWGKSKQTGDDYVPRYVNNEVEGCDEN